MLVTFHTDSEVRSTFKKKVAHGISIRVCVFQSFEGSDFNITTVSKDFLIGYPTSCINIRDSELALCAVMFPIMQNVARKQHCNRK